MSGPFAVSPANRRTRLQRVWHWRTSHGPLEAVAESRANHRADLQKSRDTLLDLCKDFVIHKGEYLRVETGARQVLNSEHERCHENSLVW